MYEIKFPNDRIISGPGSLSWLENLKGDCVMLITGSRSSEKTGLLSRAVGYLEKGFDRVVTYKVPGINPTDKMVHDGAAAMRECHPDCVVALGGGSPIDCTKLMLLLYENSGCDTDDLRNGRYTDIRHTPFIVVPTTSGTASEVTHVAVLTYNADGFKGAVKGNSLRPDIAILDGEVTVTMPDSVCAYTGMDALTHAIESYVTPSANDFTKALSSQAICGIIKWLPISYSSKDIASRQHMHNFQCMAGMAFSNSALGAVHGISHAFSGLFNTPHGLANAIILPYVMKYNYEHSQSAANDFNRLSALIDYDIIEKVRKLNMQLGIPEHIGETGISLMDFKNNFGTLVNHSLIGPTACNPVIIEKTDMEKLITEVF